MRPAVGMIGKTNMIRDRQRVHSVRQAKNLKLSLCLLALGVLLASTGHGQVLESQILLPDSLGPLYGKNHVAFDEDSVHPRIFIGGEGGDVIVADAITCERVARIRTGPMRALCYVPAYNKLYVSTTDEFGVVVADCSTYGVIKRLPFASTTTGLLYNSLVDRLYTASDLSMKVVDCANDSVVDSLPVNGLDAVCALDEAHNKLYVGAKDALRVVDCSSDSVVGRIDRIRQARAICCPPAAGKVYVAVDESLFVLNTAADTVVRKISYTRAFNARLACDLEHSRVYYTFGQGYWGRACALDCNQDEFIWVHNLWTWPSSVAPVPAQNKVYIMMSGTRYVLDGNSGAFLRDAEWDTEDSIYYCPAAHRVFVARQEYAVTSLDDQADTMAGLIPLGGPVAYLSADTVGNKLYFSSEYTQHATRLGGVDCSTNRVTWYSRILGKVRGLAYNVRDDKLYCSTDSSIFVFDRKADTPATEIAIDGVPCELAWHPNLNKLYVETCYRESTTLLEVVDCSRDTVTKVIGVGQLGRMLVIPEFNQLWVTGCGPGYCVIDCRDDSIVAFDSTTWGGMSSACYSAAEHKLYAVKDKWLSVIDLDTWLEIDTIPRPMQDTPCAGSAQAYCAGKANKVYWITVYGGMGGGDRQYDTVLALDTRSDSVVHGFALPAYWHSICDDRTGGYVYFASDWLLAVDTRTDSVVSGIHLPLSTALGPPRPLVQNRKTNRFYIAEEKDSVILVVYDSIIFAGLQAGPGTPTRAARIQTVLGRGAPLNSPTEALLFDATGRRAAILRSGPNDISRLAPGVYFIRGPKTEDGRPAAAVRKVVIAR